jgi:carboxypeptidase Taq
VKNYLKLESKIERIFLLNNSTNILYWDLITNIPKNSINSRRKEIKILTSLAHELLVSKEVEKLINGAENEARDLDIWQKTNLELIKQRRLEAICVESSVHEEFIEAVFESENIWKKAKLQNDYNSLLPYLDKVLGYTKRIAEVKAKAFNTTPYQALCMKYLPTMDIREVSSAFSRLKQELPKIIIEIKKTQLIESILPANLKVGLNEQRKFCSTIMEKLGFDFSVGRIDQGPHPFCGGAPNDIRILTRYDENNILNSIMSVAHECGHALYELNLPKCYLNQPVGKAKGMVIHESQALFLEMMVVRTKGFMEFLSEQLYNEFGFKGDEYHPDNLYKIVTHLKPNPIRIDSDEATYTLHVILRYEIEQALLGDHLKLKDLPAYWNGLMESYLGVKVVNDREGCLQDIHWPKGLFGYFPAYTIGGVYASMLHKTFKENFPNHNSWTIHNLADRYNIFLNENIRNFGSLKPVKELINDATGSNMICVDTYMEYIRSKYLVKSS